MVLLYYFQFLAVVLWPAKVGLLLGTVAVEWVMPAGVVPLGVVLVICTPWPVLAEPVFLGTSRCDVTSGDTSTQQVTLLEGSTLLRVHHNLASEPVLPPQDAHLLNRHSLGLRQEEDDVQGHQEHPKGKEDVGAILHPGQQTSEMSANLA